MAMHGYSYGIRKFEELVAPGMSDEVITCHTEQMKIERATALMNAAQNVAGVAVRPLAEAGESFHVGFMTKQENSVLFIGVFEPVANWPIPLDRKPIKVSEGYMAVALETTDEAEYGALSQVRQEADRISPINPLG